MITFKELDIFFKLCEETNLSNVAKKLNMTQSAISISLNSLEKKNIVSPFVKTNSKSFFIPTTYATFSNAFVAS